MRYAKGLSILVLIILTITLGFLNYTSTHTPLTTPEVILTYNNEKVSSVHDEHVWMDSPLDGNSFLTENPIKLTKSIKPLVVHPNTEINFRFKTKVAPKTIMVYNCISADKKVIYNQYTSKTTDKILIPAEKGEYIFEVAGGWDDYHWTSDIFKFVVD